MRLGEGAPRWLRSLVTSRDLDLAASGTFGAGRAVGLEIPQTRLSEFVRMAAGGEAMLVPRASSPPDGIARYPL